MKKILFLIVVIAFSGCVSRKTAVKENTKLDAIETVDLQVKETATNSSHTDVVRGVKTNVTDRTVTTVTETEYSEPNQHGKQHKTREKTTETRNDVQTINEANERIISEQNREIKRLTASNSELITKLNASLSEKTKTTTRLPLWIYIASFVVGAVTALFLRLWIKTKFNR